MDLTRDQEKRLDVLLKIYTKFTQEEETSNSIRRYIISGIAVGALGLGGHAGRYFIQDSYIPNTKCREWLFEGISTILSSDARDWRIYPLTGGEEITDPSIRKVYSWTSQENQCEYRIFPESNQICSEEARRAYLQKHNLVLKKITVKWNLMMLPLIDERSQTPDTEDDDK